VSEPLLPATHSWILEMFNENLALVDFGAKKIKIDVFKTPGMHDYYGYGFNFCQTFDRLFVSGGKSLFYL